MQRINPQQQHQRRLEYMATANQFLDMDTQHRSLRKPRDICAATQVTQRCSVPRCSLSAMVHSRHITYIPQCSGIRSRCCRASIRSRCKVVTSRVWRASDPWHGKSIHPSRAPHRSTDQTGHDPLVHKAPHRSTDSRATRRAWARLAPDYGIGK